MFGSLRVNSITTTRHMALLINPPHMRGSAARGWVVDWLYVIEKTMTAMITQSITIPETP
jgi:hypothetical protein